MRALRVIAGLGILTTALAPAAEAQSHPLAGKWSIEYERGRRMNNGEATPMMGKATIELTVKGDSLVGTMLNEGAAGMPAPAATPIAGTGTGGAATLKSSATSTVNLNGESRTITIAMTWELKADGDNLTGTMARVIPDMPGMGGPTPVKGTRVK
jgi:putative sterol carrier protein